MKIEIINGPNLNLLGKREEAFYGIEPFEKILESLVAGFPELTISYFQSNSEGALIDRIQVLEASGVQGLVINAGGYTHYSVAIHDALKVLAIPRLEVHMSNIWAREDFRRQSLLAPVCDGSISGFGKDSYYLALEWFRHRQRSRIGFKSNLT